MSFVNPLTTEKNYKFVLTGLKKSGKEANINFIQDKTKPEARGKSLILPFLGKEIIYYDFTLQEIFTKDGFKPRFHIYSFDFEEDPLLLYNSLGSTDGLLMVVDSLIEKLPDNKRMVKTIFKVLERLGYSISNFPFVLQFTKRDMGGILSIETILEELELRDVKYVEAVPSTGKGILESLRLLIEEAMSRS